MDLVSILIWLLMGAFIGWLAAMIMGVKKSLILTIVVGIVGSFVGGFVGGQLGLGGGWVIDIIFAVGGACIVIFVLRALRLLR